jgi:putative SOS response-associated peptidase YedK
MYIACLWSHWADPKEPDLRGFAAISDEPPADVAAAGHNRCIINLKSELQIPKTKISKPQKPMPCA